MEELKQILTIKLGELFGRLSSGLNRELPHDYLLEHSISQQLTVEEFMVDHQPLILARMDDDYEYGLFDNLLSDPGLDKFYHYTSFESLFHILSSGKLHLNSLVGLSDRSEINFINSHMGRVYTDPYSAVTLDYHKNHFVFCCSEMKDQLTNGGCTVMTERE